MAEDDDLEIWGLLDCGEEPDPGDPKWDGKTGIFSAYRRARNQWHKCAMKKNTLVGKGEVKEDKFEQQTKQSEATGKLPGEQWAMFGSKLAEEASDLGQSYFGSRFGGSGGGGAPAPTPPTMPRPPSNKPKNDKNKASESSAGGKGVGGVVLLGLGLAAAKLVGLL